MAMAAVSATLLAGSPQASADTFADGVSTQTVWDGATPIVTSSGQDAPGLRAKNQGVSLVRFARTGESIVGEKDGRLVYFSGPNADRGVELRTRDEGSVQDDTLAVQDTGLGGLAVDPGWPRRPYVYVFYTANDKLPGQGSGKWANSDCNPRGSCVVNAKIERLTLSSRRVGGRTLPFISERRTLIKDWCQAARTHSAGDLAFGPDGYLYASAGDGTPEFGGNAEQAEMCSSEVTTQYPSQMAALDALDPNVKVSLNGKVIRIDPNTGRGARGNPWGHSEDPNRQRIVGMGLRNPYRMTFSSDGSELDLTVVGQARREGIFAVDTRRFTKSVFNAGWPCLESGLPFASGPLCEKTDDRVKDVDPIITWDRNEKLDPDAPCPANAPAAAMGIAYTPGDRRMPARFRNVALFGDYALGCVWSARYAEKPKFVAQFPRHSVRDITRGPDGVMYFADYASGSVRRFDFGS